MDETLPGASTRPYKNEYFLVSFFGRMNYSLYDRYLFTFTLRNDGSSRFSEDNRWGLFPAFALAWKLTEEPFFGKSDIVNDLKLRVSWGKTGQQDVGDNFYPYIPTYTEVHPVHITSSVIHSILHCARMHTMQT